MNPYVQYMYSYPHKTAYGPLEKIHLRDYAGLLAGKGQGLYLHVPFCQEKCGYCNLFSVTGQDTGAMEGYLDALEHQSRQYQELLMPYGTEFSEFTVGGGTPLLLSEGQLERMFALVRDHLVLEEGAEIGIETAPNQTEPGKLKLLKQAGISRVSMGIQSFCDEELRRLGRRHQADRAREGLELLMKTGFSCVNVDFIYGIPGQTVESLKASLREALCFGVDEIFLYPLYVKHGAGLVREGVVPDPEQAYLQYREMSKYLRCEGFRQDSMRRFVREEKMGGGEKRENQVGFRKDRKEAGMVSVRKGAEGRTGTRRKFSECGFKTSLALGCGGRSYVGNLHFCTPYAVTRKSCLEQLRSFEETEDFLRIKHGILLSEEEQKRRYVIRHLLIRPGLPVRRYEEGFGSSLREDFPILGEWMRKGWLQEETGSCGEKAGKMSDRGERFLALTEEGMGLSDYLGPMLASQEIQEKMQKWEAIHESEDYFVSGESEKL